MPAIDSFYSKIVDKEIAPCFDISLPEKRGGIGTIFYTYKLSMCDNVNVDAAKMSLLLSPKHVAESTYERNFLGIKTNSYLELVSVISRLIDLLLKCKVPYRIIEDFNITAATFHSSDIIIRLERSMYEDCLNIFTERVEVGGSYIATPYHIFRYNLDSYEIALIGLAERNGLMNAKEGFKGNLGSNYSEDLY